MTIRGRVRRVPERLRRAWAETKHLPERPSGWEFRALIAIVVLAAALRFSTLDARSFWVDEAVVVRLIDLGLWDMLDRLLSGEEGTPPLYYALAWAWSTVFGTGEVGLRSLSALLGTATVPVAYLVGKELASHRVGLFTALLFAVSPILVWHSQDARAHTLAVFLSALSFLVFLRALREPRGSTLAWWAAVSALGLLSHYFVAFLAAAEGVWLLSAFRSRRAVWAAVGAVGVAGLTALLVAAEQLANVNLTYDQYPALGSRLVQVPGQLLVGEQPPLQRTMAVGAALLVLPALYMLVRRTSMGQRRAAMIPALVGAFALAAMALATLFGADYISARNLLPFLLPALLLIAIGLAAPAPKRWLLLALCPLCGLWLAIDITTTDVPKFEREEWRGAALALGRPDVDRAVVVTPFAGRGPLQVYLPGSELMPVSGAQVRELALVGLPPLFRRVGENPQPPRPASPPALAGFRQVDRRDDDYYTVIRLRSGSPMTVTPSALADHALGSPPPAVLVQRSAD